MTDSVGILTRISTVSLSPGSSRTVHQNRPWTFIIK